MAIRIAETVDACLVRPARAVAHLARSLRRRRLVGQLGLLDDRMLADVGITRSDVLSSLAESLFIDPSVALAERADAARQAKRATAREALKAAMRDRAEHRRAA